MATLTLRSLIIEAQRVDHGIQSAKAATETVSGNLLKLFKKYGANNLSAFLDACADTEKFIKSDDGKALTDADFQQHGIKAKSGFVPKCWTQAKSNIKQACERGIDPAAYATESDMRKALNDARKQSRGDTMTGKGFMVKGESARVLTALGLALAALDGKPEHGEMISALDAVAAKYHAAVDAAMKGAKVQQQTEGKQDNTNKPADVGAPRPDAGKVVVPAKAKSKGKPAKVKKAA